MNTNEFDTHGDLAGLRAILRAGRDRRDARDTAMTGRVMSQVRRQSTIDLASIRRVRAAAWAVASLGAAAVLVVGVMAVLAVSTPHTTRMAQAPVAWGASPEVTIAVASDSMATVSGGAGQVRLEQPMRLRVVEGALRVEPVSNRVGFSGTLIGWVSIGPETAPSLEETTK